MEEVAWMRATLKKLEQCQSDNFIKLLEGQEQMASALLDIQQRMTFAPEANKPRTTMRTRGNNWRTSCVDSGYTNSTVETSSQDDVTKMSRSDTSAYANQRAELMMQQIDEANEKHMEQQRLAMEKRGSFASLSAERIETMLDSAIGVVIVINAFFIGISMDYAESNPAVFLALDICFTAVFLLELFAKICLKGICGHFSQTSNCFDAAIVSVDFLQVFLAVAFPQAAEGIEDVPSASLLRIIRLLKLTKIIRLLKSAVFRDLLTMVRGLIGGATVLGWSIVLFFIVAYVVSLVFRETLGREKVEYVHEYFDGVPRAMYTVFRCSFGDCSTAGGMPIFEHVLNHYGAIMGLLYSVFIFVVTIGLFNVISATFVESTIASREATETAKLRARIEDETLWSTRVTILIRKLIEFSPNTACLSQESIGELHHLEVDSSALDDFIKDPVAISCLAELDIDPEDNANLADIFDPDNGGSITISDLVDGLRRLRGKPRRSDIITVDLMVRSIQLQVADVCLMIPEILKAVRKE